MGRVIANIPMDPASSLEYEQMFQQFAKDRGINKFADLRTQVIEASKNDSVTMKHYDSWERKLKLDRTIAKEVLR